MTENLDLDHGKVYARAKAIIAALPLDTPHEIVHSTAALLAAIAHFYSRVAANTPAAMDAIDGLAGEAKVIFGEYQRMGEVQ